MKYKKYGKTGSYVSALAFGAMTIGESNRWKLGGLDQETSDKMVKECIDFGVNLYDTADVYDLGESERMLGKSLVGYRDQVMIATKVRGRMGDGVNETGLSRHHMNLAIGKSLERLGTDRVDIYQYHSWDLLGDVDETLKTMEYLVDQGKVIYPAISNFNAWQMAVFQSTAKERGYSRYESAQMNYSLLNRDIEYEVLPFMKYSEMTLLSWSPLYGGILTGKYAKGVKPKEGTRMSDRGFFFPYFEENRGWEIVDLVRNIAEEQGSKMSQVSLSWLMSRGAIPLIGARTMEQLKENLESVNVNLTKEQLERLEKASSIRDMYPNWMLSRQNRDRPFEISG